MLQKKLDVKDIKLGKEKKLFYSIEIDLKFNKYGEFCMKPIKCWLYHIFEKGLKRAETEHSYFDENYNEYMNTETFGFLFIYKWLWINMILQRTNSYKYINIYKNKI